jgi:uncharacterized protein (DUF488 family)
MTMPKPEGSPPGGKVPVVQLFTLGYEGLTPDGYFDIIQAAGVETLVDVRRTPLSRKPGYSKKRLAEAAQSRGVRYEHMVTLGTPRDVLYDYRADHNHAEFDRRFREYLDTQSEAIAQLAELVQREVCCLLCVEADPRHCHRTVVAEYVRARIRCEVVELEAQ